MTLRILAAVAAVLMGGNVAAHADSERYGSGEFFTLDLQRALLSPKPLGPGAQFEAFPIEARADAKNAIDAAADEPVVRKAPPLARPPRAGGPKGRARGPPAAQHCRAPASGAHPDRPHAQQSAGCQCRRYEDP